MKVELTREEIEKAIWQYLRENYLSKGTPFEFGDIDIEAGADGELKATVSVEAVTITHLTPPTPQYPPKYS